MEIEERIKILENDFKLPKGFYRSLLSQDDWSFVLKLAALFERACAFSLSMTLHSKLSDEFSKLDQFVRVKWLTKIGVITNDQSDFLQELAKLRNDLVHKIDKVNFNFSSYIGSLDKNQIKKFIRIFGFNVKEHIEINTMNIRSSKKKMLLSHPKISIWCSASEVLACIHIEKDKKAIREEKRKIDENIIKLHAYMPKKTKSAMD
jgi:uncharacterized protein YutE (UPF0331/DUF86 family)